MNRSMNKPISFGDLAIWLLRLTTDFYLLFMNILDQEKNNYIDIIIKGSVCQALIIRYLSNFVRANIPVNSLP